MVESGSLNNKSKKNHKYFMADVVEFTSLSDETKKLIKDYEQNLLTIQIPDWCDLIRIGKGEYFLPKDKEGFYGEYKLEVEKKRIYVCERVNSNENSDCGLFRDGVVRNIEPNSETISPETIASRKADVEKSNKWFFEEHPELPQFDY